MTIRLQIINHNLNITYYTCCGVLRLRKTGTWQLDSGSLNERLFRVLLDLLGSFLLKERTTVEYIDHVQVTLQGAEEQRERSEWQSKCLGTDVYISGFVIMHTRLRQMVQEQLREEKSNTTAAELYQGLVMKCGGHSPLYIIIELHITVQRKKTRMERRRQEETLTASCQVKLACVELHSDTVKYRWRSSQKQD